MATETFEIAAEPVRLHIDDLGLYPKAPGLARVWITNDGNLAYQRPAASADIYEALSTLLRLQPEEVEAALEAAFRIAGGESYLRTTPMPSTEGWREITVKPSIPPDSIGDPELAGGPHAS